MATLEVDRGGSKVRAAIENARRRHVGVEVERLVDEDVIPLRPRRHRVDVPEPIWRHRNLPAVSARLVDGSPFELLQHRALRRRPDVMSHIACKTPEMRDQWFTPAPSNVAGAR